MMTNLGMLSSQAAARVRDPGFNSTTQPQVISLLSYAQQVANAALDEETGSQPLVLQPRTLIYQLSGFVPQSVRVQGVRDSSGRDLDAISFENLQQIDLRWPVAVSDSPRSWCQCGRDLLIIHPGVTTPETVTVIYTLLTPTLAGTSDTTVVQQETDSAVLDLGELLLLIQHRDLSPFQNALERFRSRIKELRGEER